jgi:5-methylcytosine-specific restriction endonuclease McrA
VARGPGTCIECGSPFTQRMVHKQYCSIPCRLRASHRRWANRNRDRLASYSRERRKGLSGLQRWILSLRDPINKALLQGAYRARKRDTVSSISRQEWLGILNRYNGKCAYCQSVMDKPTMDHRLALSRGGAHIAVNVIPACRSCNCRKGAMDEGEFRIKLMREISLRTLSVLYGYGMIINKENVWKRL